jgi:apolipoprotein N-acyltransferase
VGRRAPFLICLASGSALAFCLPKPGLTFLAWFVPAFFLHQLSRAKDGPRAFLLGWLFGAAFCGTALHWIYLTCRFAGVSVPVSFLALCALAAFLGLNWGVFAALARAFQLRLPAWALPWAWAALLAAIEAAGALFLGVRVAPDVLAYTQWRHPILLQGLSWAGPHALGFLILLANGVLLSLLRRERGAFANLAAAGLLLAGWCGYGAQALASRDAGSLGREFVRVEILQPNIDQYRKWDERYEGDIRQAFDDLLGRPREAAPGLILWPESALPGWLDDPRSSRWVGAWARRLKAPMLLGSVSRLGERNYNSAALFDEQGRPAGLYHKRRLVPFGEFVPFRRWLEPHIGILAQLGDFTAGPPRQPLISTPLGPLAVSICYEAVFSDLLRLDAERGARVFANLTNDGWYKDTWGPHQHFWVNAFRAVENRVTVLRSANTGISGIIDPYGIVLARTPLLSRTRLDARVAVGNPFRGGSFYARHGDWFGVLCMACSLLAASFCLRRPRRGAGRPA